MTAPGVHVSTGQMSELLLDGSVRRFVQDSPILPDVWCWFGAQAAGAYCDLLLTHHEAARSAAVAADIRKALKAHRDSRQAEESEGNWPEPSVAPLPGFIAAAVSLEELFTVVLPRTTWWSTLVRDDPGVLDRSREQIDALAAAVAAFRDLNTAYGETLQKQVAESGFPVAWLWLVSNAGALLAAKRPRNDAPPAAWPPDAKDSVEAAVEAFARAFPEGMLQLPNERTIWSVALDRQARPATEKSVLAVKGDAARRLFNISCSRITWAVLDTGIDRTHPAFDDWKAEPDENGDRPTRVIRTFDFTRIRKLLDPAYLNSSVREGGSDEKLVRQIQRYLEHHDKPSDFAAVARHVNGVRERIEEGLDIDWATLEPFLELVDPQPPSMSHGTHVAGILGADWREGDKVRLEGMCPDIKLIDMRVISDGAGAEFSVIAALQFIRYLNSRGESQTIHGANLSFVTPHNVQSYACGSTPVCAACDTLAASGVVLVAAAGNEGHRSVSLGEAGDISGYLAISITDPGNANRVITVGSAHRERPHQYGVSYFSSRGPTGDGRIKPDLVAPGEKINSTLPGPADGSRDGTSQAAPHVSGAAALLMARYPEFIGKPDRIKKILCDTATDLGRDRYFQGAGMLDVLRALQSI